MAGTGPNGLGLLWLVVLAVAMNAVSLYYYLQVLKQIYVVETPATSDTQATSVITQVVLAVPALAMVVPGCAPDLLISKLVTAIKLAGL